MAGTVLLCSVYKDWWYTKRFLRESTEFSDIGLLTLAYRLFVTIFLFTLQLLICVATIIYLTIAHIEAVGQHDAALITELEVFSFLWLLVTMAVTSFALPVTVDIINVTRHFLVATLSPAERDLESNIEDFPTHLSPTNYGTIDRPPFRAGYRPDTPFSPAEGDRFWNSDYETSDDSSSESLLPRAAPHTLHLFPRRTQQQATISDSGSARPAAKSPEYDTVLQCDLFDADDELDEDSEEEVVSPS
ncbi:MAG: hypothetical protein Q9191_004866 [Dirinaria sp. TL-2023a]